MIEEMGVAETVTNAFLCDLILYFIASAPCIAIYTSTPICAFARWRSSWAEATAISESDKPLATASGSISSNYIISHK